MALILVVDDEFSVAEVLQSVLVDAGHEVVTAVNGQQGLELLGKDVLHVDADMCGAVRQETKRQRFQPLRLSPVLAEHRLHDIGDRRQLEWFAQERGIHAVRGCGDCAFRE